MSEENNPNPPPIISKEELTEIIQEYINRIQGLPIDAMFAPATQSDLVSLLLLMKASLNCE